MMNGSADFPFSLVISIPLPTNRLASSALRALRVDAELSPLVHRSFSLVVPAVNDAVREETWNHTNGHETMKTAPTQTADVETLTVLRTEYKATTNRMLRVAVNGFMESLGVVLSIMEELDTDVLAEDNS